MPIERPETPEGQVTDTSSENSQTPPRQGTEQSQEEAGRGVRRRSRGGRRGRRMGRELFPTGESKQPDGKAPPALYDTTLKY